VVVEGRLSSIRPLLVVSNHCSYLDVMILGAVIGPAFTPKAEVAAWPLIGWICRVTDCIFIDRRISKTQQNQEALRQAAREGFVISLFPEGTTNDGKRLLPFRSSYFSLCEENFGGRPLTVQPVAISYTRVRGLPIDSSQRPQIAWYGDMEFVPHLAGLLRLGRIDAKVTFCEPVPAEAGRKVVAAQCMQLIEQHIISS